MWRVHYETCCGFAEKSNWRYSGYKKLIENTIGMFHIINRSTGPQTALNSLWSADSCSHLPSCNVIKILSDHSWSCKFPHLFQEVIYTSVNYQPAYYCILQWRCNYYQPWQMPVLESLNGCHSSNKDRFIIITDILSNCKLAQFLLKYVSNTHFVLYYCICCQVTELRWHLEIGQSL